MSGNAAHCIPLLRRAWPLSLRTNSPTRRFATLRGANNVPFVIASRQSVTGVQRAWMETVATQEAIPEPPLSFCVSGSIFCHNRPVALTKRSGFSGLARRSHSSTSTGCGRRGGSSLSSPTLLTSCLLRRSDAHSSSPVAFTQHLYETSLLNAASATLCEEKMGSKKSADEVQLAPPRNTIRHLLEGLRVIPSAGSKRTPSAPMISRCALRHAAMLLYCNTVETPTHSWVFPTTVVYRSEDIRLLVVLLVQLVSVDDAADAVGDSAIPQLLYCLLCLCQRGREASSPSQETVWDSLLEESLRNVVAAATPTHTATVLSSLQVGKTFPATAAAHDILLWRLRGGRCWHPSLSGTAIKGFLKHLGHTITEKRGKDGALPLATLARLHTCCFAHVPLTVVAPLRKDCAVLLMAALKYASFHDLCTAFVCLDEANLASWSVMTKFLAHCGTCVQHIRQGGFTIGSVVVGTDPSRLPLRVCESLLESKAGLGSIESGLVHICGLLNALKCPEAVRALYARVPDLRETPHSVMSWVEMGDVTKAVMALGTLGRSKAEGWVSIPATVMEVMVAVSHMVGREGRPADMQHLYIALVGFHNAGLFMSQLVECVIAGLCDRLQRLPEVLRSAGPGQDLTPRDVLELIIPMARAVMGYVGDELNTDMILELVETALQVDGFAVPLTAGLIWTLRSFMDRSLCLQELLQRFDASTQNTPFLYYYTLCHARDYCSAATFDHLAALWHVDGTALWGRAPHLSPSCQLWKCSSCGRLNTDRFNYCVCSSLRYSHVVCASCGYGQDERIGRCRSCGERLTSKASIAAAVVRKAWCCRECGARNPAKQTVQCFRCGKACGPLVSSLENPLEAVAPSQSESVGNAAVLRPFCECSNANSHYSRTITVCHCCGEFKNRFAAAHSEVWICAGCQQRRSSLERVCPACPCVECLPHAICGEASARRRCRHCGAEALNPFQLICRSCGNTDDPFSELSEEMETVGVAPAAEPSNKLSDATSVLHWCRHCSHAQAYTGPVVQKLDVESFNCDGCGAVCEIGGLCSAVQRSCPSCSTALPPKYMASIVCSFCFAYVPPIDQPQGGRLNSAVVLQTCEAMEWACTTELALLPTEKGGGGTTPVAHRPLIERTILQVVEDWTTSNDVVNGNSLWQPIRIDMAMILGRAVNRLRPLLPTSLTARRVSALLRQLETHVDAMCGIASPTHFTPEEVCHECLGSHPEAFCGFRHILWMCDACGAENTNDGVCRYFCVGCLALRPQLQSYFTSTCWECSHCHRTNVELERYCIYCGLLRSYWSQKLLHHGASSDKENFIPHQFSEAAEKGYDSGARGEEPDYLDTLWCDETVDPRTLAEQLPFNPAKCPVCASVFIEARCPSCALAFEGSPASMCAVHEVPANFSASNQLSSVNRRMDHVHGAEAMLNAVPLVKNGEARQGLTFLSGGTSLASSRSF